MQTDQRRLRNDRWQNDSLAKRPTFQDATKTEQATQEFDNKEIGQDATETEQATMLDEETQTEEFIYSRDRIVTHPQTLISLIQTTKFAFTPVYPPKKS